MITELGVKRTVRVLTDAGFHPPKRMDFDAMSDMWMDAVKQKAPHLDDDVLRSAAVEYTSRDHPAVAWPTPGQLIDCASAVRNRTESRFYTEPEPEAPKATPEEARLAWKAAGYDPDAVRQELGMRRGPRLPKTWAEEAKEVIDRTLATGAR